jgi:hypothetical protein
MRPNARALLEVTALMLGGMVAFACGQSGGSSPPHGQDAGGGDASAAGADADTGAGPGLCPDPTNPGVHYRDMDPTKCMGVVLDCTTNQNGFQNACGCGCIDKGTRLCPVVDDPAITWISHDASMCPSSPMCPLGQTPFSTMCGCGCVQPG